MKAFKITTLIVFIFASGMAFSQPTKGGFLVGGTVSASSAKYKYTSTEAKQKSISLNPTVGYFPVNNFLVGLSVPVSFSKSESAISGINGDYTIESKSNAIGIGPFLRYYIPVNEKLFVLTHAGYAFRWEHYESGSPFASDGDNKTKQLKVGAGLSYFVNKNVAIEMLVAHNRVSSTDDQFDQTTTTLGVEIGFQIYLAK